MRVSTNQFSNVSSNSILEQQARLLKIQEQVATGKRIVNPADDPTGATRALNLEKVIGSQEQFARNMDRAELALQTEENSLDQATNLLQRVRELTVQALNGTQTAESRKAIAAEIRQIEDQLLDVANATNGSGEFLFAGSRSRSEPFVRDGGEVQYLGDQTERLLQASESRQLPTNHTGLDVFMRVPQSEGDLVTAGGDGNSGSGVISTARTTDSGQEFAGPYTIEFETDADGNLVYSVTNGADEEIVAAEPFSSGDSISLDGRQFSIQGTPAEGDTFTLDRTRSASVFSTLGNLADALEAGGSDSAAQARFANVANNVLGGLDAGLSNIGRVRSEVGARLNAIDAERDANEARVLDLKSAKSKIEDLDYAEAIADLQLRQVGLQAAQQSYLQIQGLSLFNFL